MCYCTGEVFLETIFLFVFLFTNFECNLEKLLEKHSAFFGSLHPVDIIVLLRISSIFRKLGNIISLHQRIQQQ